jgi:hypothetical protein
MRVDLSRVQQASALLSDDDSDNGSFEEDPPEWDSRNEPFDEYWERAQRYTHRPNQELPRRSVSSLPSPFLKPTRPAQDPRPRQEERLAVHPQHTTGQALNSAIDSAKPRRRKRPMMSTLPPAQRVKGV